MKYIHTNLSIPIFLVHRLLNAPPIFTDMSDSMTTHPSPPDFSIRMINPPPDHSTPLNVTVPDSPSFSSGEHSFTSIGDQFGIPLTPSSMNSFMAGSPDTDSLPEESTDVFFPDALLAAGSGSDDDGRTHLPDLGNRV